MKQIRLTFNIGKHDMEVRAKQTEEFLKQGLKVQIEIVLRGREKSHKDLATEKLKNFLSSIQHPYKIIQDIKSSPRGLTIVIG